MSQIFCVTLVQKLNSPLAVGMELGCNRGAKATCHLLCIIFHFAFWFCTQQKPMKLMTSCPASSQSLLVSLMIACVLKHGASHSPQILMCFHLHSSNVCERQVFRMGIRSTHREVQLRLPELCLIVPPQLTQVEPGQIDPQGGPVPEEGGGSSPSTSSWLPENEGGWGTPPQSTLLPPHRVLQVAFPSVPPSTECSCLRPLAETDLFRR